MTIQLPDSLEVVSLCLLMKYLHFVASRRQLFLFLNCMFFFVNSLGMLVKIC